mmetsp:Transcript_6584/g.15215  ORF Transcript_6584/g.15215 Transcript_6584/m.15215 type:complete len:196 (-) Transcript_6584:46-633(-)
MRPLMVGLLLVAFAVACSCDESLADILDVGVEEIVDVPHAEHEPDVRRQLDLDDVPKLRVKELRKFLYDRGVECVGCTEKPEFVKKVQESLDLPVLEAGQRRTKKAQKKKVDDDVRDLDKEPPSAAEMAMFREELRRAVAKESGGEPMRQVTPEEFNQMGGQIDLDNIKREMFAEYPDAEGDEPADALDLEKLEL